MFSNLFNGLDGIREKEAALRASAGINLRVDNGSRVSIEMFFIVRETWTLLFEQYDVALALTSQ